MRVEFPGAIYHVMNRGDRREPIFRDDADRRRFVETLAEVCVKTDWQVQAYVLMPNHFHLVVETPRPNLVTGMKWLLGTFTGRFNRRHQVSGHLFSGRYKTLIVDGASTGYLKTVCDFVHMNPVRAKLLSADQSITDFVWSSWPAYLRAPAHRPAWMRVDRLLVEYGIARDSPAGRRELEGALEERRMAEEGGGSSLVRRGWCLGGGTFRRELLARMTERLGAEHYGEERKETEEAKAERILAAELKRRRWDVGELESRSKGDAEKVTMAVKLREETAMTLGWIAGRLRMGTRGYLNHLLYRRRKRAND